MKRILFVGYRDPYHSSAGGYDKITNYPGADVLLDIDVPFGFIPMHQRGKVINTICLDIIARSRKDKYDIIHYFYGDMLLFPFHKVGGGKVVATIHMDLNQRVKLANEFIKTLQSLDGVISLSSKQKEELKRFGINSTFIPHGFNEPIFIKKDMKLDKDKINIVISGSNYRDEETMLSAINYCKENKPEVYFHLLGQSTIVKNRLLGYINSHCYPRLSDDEYYSLMSSCDYNFLPLTFATANNALLEAEFLGLRSILPKIPGIEDYAASEPINIFYSSNEDIERLFDELKKEVESKELKDYARRFLWSNIYPQLEIFFNSL